MISETLRSGYSRAADGSAVRATVRRRLVYYIPGYDPYPPRRYRELYRSEGEAQAKIAGYDLALAPMNKKDEIYRFQVKARIDGIDTTSEFRFLPWNDLVDASMSQTMLGSWKQAAKTAWVYISTGALSAVWRTRRPSAITALYPYFFLIAQFLAAIFIFFLSLNLIGAFLPKIIGALAGFGLGYFLLRYFYRNDAKFLSYYLLHDYAFTVSERGRTPAALRTRLQDFEREITAGLEEGFDEVLIVGHSSGAHLGLIVLSEMLRKKVVKPRHNLAILSLGQAIPMVSFLPEAGDLRRALYDMSRQKLIPWVDITAPSDGACFALIDPVAVNGVKAVDADYPRILSAAFTNTMNKDNYDKIKHRFFRLHFQYLCAFDKPGIYDYFRVTAGPLRLWERYSMLSDSPSTDRRAMTPYREMDNVG